MKHVHRGTDRHDLPVMNSLTYRAHITLEKEQNFCHYKLYNVT